MKYNKYSKKMIKNLILKRGIPNKKVYWRWVNSLEPCDIVDTTYETAEIQAVTDKSVKLKGKWFRKSRLHYFKFGPGLINSSKETA